MCFSATASYTAGTALIAVGAVTVSRSRGKAELPLALVPLLFGVRQLSEGLLWLFSKGLPLLQSWATYVFSLFSLMLWPIFVPFAILLVVTSRRRKKALRTFESVWCVYAAVLSLLILIHFSGPMQAYRPEPMRSRERAVP